MNLKYVIIYKRAVFCFRFIAITRIYSETADWGGSKCICQVISYWRAFSFNLLTFVVQLMYFCWTFLAMVGSGYLFAVTVLIVWYFTVIFAYEWLLNKNSSYWLCLLNCRYSEISCLITYTIYILCWCTLLHNSCQLSLTSQSWSPLWSRCCR